MTSFPQVKVISEITHSAFLKTLCLNLSSFADVDVIEDDDDEDMESVSSWTTHMLRGTWLSSNHNIFHYGLPTPLLNYLRRAHGLVHHSETDVTILDYVMFLLFLTTRHQLHV